MNPMDLKRGIDKAVAAAAGQLAEISKPCWITGNCPGRHGVANADELLAASLLKRWKKSAKKAITVEEGKSLDNELDVVEGMQFDRGYRLPRHQRPGCHAGRSGKSVDPDSRQRFRTSATCRWRLRRPPACVRCSDL